jgi:hypothetical protein
VDDLGREGIEPPEGSDEEDRERAEVGEHEPADRPRQQEGEAGERVVEEERGETPPRTGPGRRLVRNGVSRYPFTSVQAWTHSE